MSAGYCSWKQDSIPPRLNLLTKPFITSAPPSPSQRHSPVKGSNLDQNQSKSKHSRVLTESADNANIGNPSYSRISDNSKYLSEQRRRSEPKCTHPFHWGRWVGEHWIPHALYNDPARALAECPGCIERKRRQVRECLREVEYHLEHTVEALDLLWDEGREESQRLELRVAFNFTAIYSQLHTTAIRDGISRLEGRLVKKHQLHVGKVIPACIKAKLRPLSIKERHTTPCRFFVVQSKVHCSFVVVVVINSKNTFLSSILGHSHCHGFSLLVKERDFINPQTRASRLKCREAKAFYRLGHRLFLSNSSFTYSFSFYFNPFHIMGDF